MLGRISKGEKLGLKDNYTKDLFSIIAPSQSRRQRDASPHLHIHRPAACDEPSGGGLDVLAVAVAEADHVLVQLDGVEHLHQRLLLQLHLLRRIAQVLHALKSVMVWTEDETGKSKGSVDDARYRIGSE